MPGPISLETPTALKITRSERLRRTLADEIVSGRLGAGTRLDEQELSLRFGVSRTPVREALRQLVSASLVEIRPHRGVFVARLEAARVVEMFEVLGGLEALAGRLAAERMSAAERRGLEDLHLGSAGAVRDGDSESYETANMGFHAAIFAGSHNAYLEETAVAMRHRLRPFSQGQFRLLGRLAGSYAEHGRIVAAVLRADVDAAEAEMRRHVAQVGRTSASYVEAKVGGSAPAAVST